MFGDARRCVVPNGIPPPKTTRAESRHSRWHEERGARRQARRGQLVRRSPFPLLPPFFPAPASLPAPLFCATRRVATSGWGIAPHAGATRRRNEWLSKKGRISSRFRSPSTPSVGSSKSKQAGGRGVCRCAAFCLSACCLLCYAAPPLPLPAPPMKGKAHPIALLCLLHVSTASAGSAVRFACELPVPASSINRK